MQQPRTVSGCAQDRIWRKTSRLMSMRCCAVLCCAVLCCAVLCCAGPGWTKLSLCCDDDGDDACSMHDISTDCSPLCCFCAAFMLLTTIAFHAADIVGHRARARPGRHTDQLLCCGGQHTVYCPGRCFDGYSSRCCVGGKQNSCQEIRSMPYMLMLVCVLYRRINTANFAQFTFYVLKTHQLGQDIDFQQESTVTGSQWRMNKCQSSQCWLV